MNDLETIAHKYWDSTPAEFEGWLAARATKEPGSVYEAVWSAYLSGMIDDDWASQFAQAAA